MSTAREYDSNFCFPLPSVLESDKVKLTPLVPSQHAQAVFDQMQRYPEIFNLLPMEPFSDFAAFATGYLANNIQRDSGSVTFVIFDKTKPGARSSSSSDNPSDNDNADANANAGALAGIISLVHASATDLTAEIGCAMVFPPFQRTHVTTHAVGLLLHYTLDLPSSSSYPSHSSTTTSSSASPPTPTTTLMRVPEALGLRRLSWRANALNTASIHTAQRMGFTLATILRWNRVFPPGKAAVGAGNGRALRVGDPRAACPGVDSAVLGLCWDEWEEGGRERVDAAMSRVG